MTTTYRNERARLDFGRPTMIALCLLVLGFWLAIGAVPAGGATAHAAPVKKVPSTHANPDTIARPPSVPGLSISISDGRNSAARGDQLRYVVEVKNAGRTNARNLRITVTLPPYLSLNSASQHSVAKAGKVSWRASLRPGRTASFTMSAVVGKTPRGMGHLAVVACAAPSGTGQNSGPPVVCAAHLDRLPGAAGITSSSSRASGRSGSSSSSSSSADAGSGKIRALVAGLIVVAGVLLAALAARRIRGRKGPGHARI